MRIYYRLPNLIAACLLLLNRLLALAWSHEGLDLVLIGACVWFVSAGCVFAGWRWAWWTSFICGTGALLLVVMLAPSALFSALAGGVRAVVFMAFAVISPIAWLLHFGSRSGET